MLPPVIFVLALPPQVQIRLCGSSSIPMSMKNMIFFFWMSWSIDLQPNKAISSNTYTSHWHRSLPHFLTTFRHDEQLHLFKSVLVFTWYSVNRCWIVVRYNTLRKGLLRNYILLCHHLRRQDSDVSLTDFPLENTVHDPLRDVRAVMLLGNKHMVPLQLSGLLAKFLKADNVR